MRNSHDNTIRFITLGIIIGVIIAWVLFSIGAKLTGLSFGPVQFEIPTSQPQVPVIRPQPENQPNQSGLQYVGTIRVFGNSKQGVQVRIDKSGTYRFAYRGGAYSVYPINGAPQGMKTWLTAIFIFAGDKALWNGDTIKDDELLLRLADTKYWSSAEEAEQSAQGMYVETTLNGGQVLTLIAVDHLSSYADNPGQVSVDMFYVEQ